VHEHLALERVVVLGVVQRAVLRLMVCSAALLALAAARAAPELRDDDTPNQDGLGRARRGGDGMLGDVVQVTSLLFRSALPPRAVLRQMTTTVAPCADRGRISPAQPLGLADPFENFMRNPLLTLQRRALVLHVTKLPAPRAENLKGIDGYNG